MENNNFSAAVEEFISQRINDCENNETPEVSAAQADFDKALSKADTKTGNSIEDAYCSAEGEIKNRYYRAGFADAITFLMGWRDGTWL